MFDPYARPIERHSWGEFMSAVALEEVAFFKPGGESVEAIKLPNPIDLAHLGEQVMHDASLEREVLSLFSTQVSSMVMQLKSANMRERQVLAHTLSGSARGVGAFKLADLAEALELMPNDMSLVAPLEDECVRTADFIASLSR